MLKFELHLKDESGTKLEDVLNINTPEQLKELSKQYGGKQLMIEFGNAFDVQRIVIRKDNEEWI